MVQPSNRRHAARRVSPPALELGQRVAGSSSVATLVSDEIVIDRIEQRLPEAEAAGGAIFDGFPRTLAQAQALDAMLEHRGSRYRPRDPAQGQ